MIYIEVPDENDSLSRIVLSDIEYFIRFTYNSKYDYWSFAIYDIEEEPILTSVKIVPMINLTHFYDSSDLPDGMFGCFSDVEHIGYDSFQTGKAQFVYIPNSELEGWEPDAEF